MTHEEKTEAVNIMAALIQKLEPKHAFDGIAAAVRSAVRQAAIKGPVGSDFDESAFLDRLRDVAARLIPLAESGQ